MVRYLVFLGILMGGCASHMTSWRDERGQTDLALEEMRIEISDLKHALHAAKVDQQLLEEKVKSQETVLKSGTKAVGKSPENALQLVSLERKLNELQKNYEKLSQDLKQTLTKYQEKLRELDQEIASQNRRLEEVVKLKGTLSSLSQVLKEKSGSSSNKKYRIKSGDSLEKIAKQHRTSVETLKKLNDMSGDRIIVGQEISVPDTDE